MIFLSCILLAAFFEAFFSGAETAFLSVNFLKLMHLIEKKNKAAMLVHDLLKKPDRLLATTLIGTNISVVASSACATAFFANLSPHYGALLATLVMTPFSFIFCQLLPKTALRYKANRAVLYLARPLSMCEKVLFPFVSFFTFFANSVARIVHPKGLKKNPFLTKDEIKSLIKDISREGILEAHEKEAIDQIFDMTLTKAADTMVPLKNIVAVSVDDDIENIKEKCRVSQFTRFPVFEGSQLKGVINIFDLFYSTGVPSGEWKDFIRPVLRVENNEAIDKVFSKMQPNREMMAAVYEGARFVGILTMEDLVEDVVSKISSARK